MAVLTPGLTTLGSIRNQSRVRANMVNNYAVTDPEFNSFLQLSQTELYGKLVSAFREKYFLSQTTITTDGTNEQYQLPSDFYKIIGADWQQSPGTTLSNVTLRPWEWNDRNRWSVPFFPSVNGWMTIYYNVIALTGKIWFKPVPPGGLNILVYYAPRLTVPEDQVQLFVPVAGTHGDTFVLTHTFANQAPITVTLTGAASTSGLNYQNAVSPFATASALAAAINTNLGVYLSAQAIGQTVTITYTNPYVAQSSQWASTPTTSFTGITNTSSAAVLAHTNTWSNTVDGVNGWEEYIIVDAAIKALQLQEKDISVLMAQKQMLDRRIEGESKHRDTGFAPRQGGPVETRGDLGFGYGGM